MLKIIIFFIFSLIMLKISWPDIFDTHTRKFCRFFAFEFLFLLILVNFGYWLRNPFTVFRVFTWIILLSSFVIADCGIHHLLRGVNPQTKNEFLTTNDKVVTTFYQLLSLSFYNHIGQYIRNPRMLLDIETTTNLVTSGIYKYIRHPLYSSLIILGAVTLIKNPSLLATSLFSVGTVFLHATARIEEKENLLKFGEDYAEYMTRSSMFFSFLF